MRYKISIVLLVSTVLVGPALYARDLSHLKLAPGFKIDIVADGLKSPRSIALSPNGVVYLGTRTAGRRNIVGDVYAFELDENYALKGKVRTVASGLNVPNGVAWHNGDLYIAEIGRVIKLRNIDEHLDDPPEPVVINEDFPEDYHHGWKFIRFSPDDKLYVPVGAPCNVCEDEQDTHSNIQRMNPDGSEREVFARGVRNTVGFDWHPATGHLWFTDNGRDLMGDYLPADELNYAPNPKMHFGFPYCHQGDVKDPEYGNETDKHCREFSEPVAKLGPHVAALGMRFYTGKQFPEKYRGQPIIALHGSWNRSEEAGHTGGKLVVAHLDGNLLAEVETLVDGWLGENNEWLGRPVDVEQLPDGSMLISDDHAGVIYRLSYEDQPSAQSEQQAQ